MWSQDCGESSEEDITALLENKCNKDGLPVVIHVEIQNEVQVFAAYWMHMTIDVDRIM